MRRITRSAVIETSTEAFYALVEDIESYPQFLPWCAAASVQSRTPGKTVATLALNMKGVRQSFTTENVNVPGRSIEMRLIEGPFKHFTAGWQFGALGERGCKAEFSLAFEFASRILAATLGPLFERMADETVEAFVRRARSGETAR